MGGETHGLTCHTFINPIHLVENKARLYYADPKLWTAFPFTHTRFCRFFGDWFIRKEPNPDFATTPDMASHSYTTRFDLPTGNPGGFKCLQGILPETDLVSTTRLTTHPAPVLFTKFRL